MSFNLAAYHNLQQEMKSRHMGAFFMPLCDPFGTDTVGPYYNAFPWLTGFTGSSGKVLLTPERSVVAIDSRYTLQGKTEIDSTWFEIISNDPAALKAWVKNNLFESKIYYDPWLFTTQSAENWSALFKSVECLFVPTADIKGNIGNPVYDCWPERPTPPNSPIISFPMSYTGQSTADKITMFWQNISSPTADAFLLINPELICWLLNIRGQDTLYTPIILSYALLWKNGRVDLFLHDSEHRLKDSLHHMNLHVHPFENFLPYLNQVASQQTLLVDWNESPMAIRLTESTFQSATNPCFILKAQKNSVEIENFQKAHVMDGAAVVKFLMWLQHHASEISLTEYSASEKLESFRKENSAYRGPSFPTIFGVGDHSAIIHYHATSDHSKTLEHNQICLVDSGGQYYEGTTDITRTFLLGQKATDFQKKIYTAVLKGFIRLATTRFPKGTKAAQLDALARYDLWQLGLDYPHSTGHGVGHYLSVHEGPITINGRNISSPLLPGMVFSNEPGCYLEGEFGVRIENLMFVAEDPKDEMLYFENLTLVPLDANLIDFHSLNNPEKKWLKDYHLDIIDQLADHLLNSQKTWLRKTCESFLNVTS